MQLAPITPVVINHIGENVHEVLRASTRAFIGLIRQTPSGEWRTQGEGFGTAAEASDALIRSKEGFGR